MNYNCNCTLAQMNKRNFSIIDDDLPNKKQKVVEHAEQHQRFDTIQQIRGDIEALAAQQKLYEHIEQQRIDKIQQDIYQVRADIEALASITRAFSQRYYGCCHN